MLLLKLLIPLLCIAALPPGELKAQAESVNYSDTVWLHGKASYYSDYFVGRMTANGEVYYHDCLTAAHLTLPFGTVVRVVNPENDQHVVVRINDRGPYHPNRIIDLSLAAADSLGFVYEGVTDVKMQILDMP